MARAAQVIDAEAIAAEALAAQRGGRQIAPFSGRIPGFDLAAAYRAADAQRRLREAGGEAAVGRKIGFTNRTIWPQYGVDAPMWGYVYDATLVELGADARFSLAGFSEPLIEPEVAFGLARAPAPDMDEAALVACIEWIAPSFEIVHSIFPGWRFAAADTVAAGGMHAALLLGPRTPIGDAAEDWRAALPAFSLELRRDGQSIDVGRSSDLLGGPLAALAHLVALVGADPASPPLAAGEIVTTGTLTRAFPIAAGQTWSTRPLGIPLPPIGVTFE